MAILVELRPDIEGQLRAEADSKGLPVAELAGKLIEAHAACPSASPRFRTPEELERHLMGLAKECHKLPLLVGCTAEEIIGYDDDGLPYR